MSGRFVRASKFRHVFGTKARPERSYLNIKADITGDMNHIASSTAFFAVVTGGGGGPVQVHPHGRFGRIAETARVNVHKQKVVDLDFSPFVDNLLATASEDATARITQVTRDGNIANIEKADQTLEGHQKKLGTLRWHPCASNVIATAAYDNLVKVWDVEKGKDIFDVKEHTDTPSSLEWNEDGSLLATTCKDKQVRIFDPRRAGSIMKIAGLDGVRPPRIAWLHKLGKLAIVGHNRSNMRQFQVFDQKSFSAVLATVDIDSAAGSIIPYFDADTGVLFIAGKGDAAIKYWEAVNEEPYLHYLQEFRESESTKGCCFVPKAIVDVKSCEIGCALRIMRDGVIPVSFTVPRKSDLFQSDIFPDTYAGRPVSTADEYAGGTDRPPALRSLRPGTDAGAKTAAPVFEKRADAPASASASASAHASGGGHAGASVASLTAELATANARIAELEAELAKLRASH